MLRFLSCNLSTRNLASVASCLNIEKDFTVSTSRLIFSSNGYFYSIGYINTSKSEIKPRVPNVGVKIIRGLSNSPKMGRYICKICNITKQVQVGRKVILCSIIEYNIYTKINFCWIFYQR